MCVFLKILICGHDFQADWFLKWCLYIFWKTLWIVCVDTVKGSAGAIVGKWVQDVLRNWKLAATLNLKWGDITKINFEMAINLKHIKYLKWFRCRFWLQNDCGLKLCDIFRLIQMISVPSKMITLRHSILFWFLRAPSRLPFPGTLSHGFCELDLLRAGVQRLPTSWWVMTIPIYTVMLTPSVFSHDTPKRIS